MAGTLRSALHTQRPRLVLKPCEIPPGGGPIGGRRRRDSMKERTSFNCATLSFPL
jgi:hypothetical protein